MLLIATFPSCRSMFRFTVFVAAAWLSMPCAFCQKPPGLGYVFPPAVCAGKSTVVDFGGYDFTIDLQWFVHDHRIQLQTQGVPGDYLVPPPPYWFGPRASLPAMPIPREVTGKLTVPVDQPEGLVRWQVANANGASETSVFFVSHGREIIEQRSRDLPQRLDSLPIAVSGRLSRLTEVDRYEIVSDCDQLISIDLMARRLGSDINGVLQVRDHDGKMIAELVDTQGLDGRLTFPAVAGHVYSIGLNDLDFRGDRAYVYRLAFTSGPRVSGMIPAMAQRGSVVEMEFFGPGLRTGSASIESIREVIRIVDDREQKNQTYRLHAANAELDVEIPLSNIDEFIRKESSPDSRPDTDTPLPQTIATPAGVTGRFHEPGESHLYSWSAEQGEWWTLDVQARAWGSEVDVALEVLDGSGNRVAENDDGAINSDSSLSFKAPSSGVFTAIVRAVSITENTADPLYRLQIMRQPADFQLIAPQQIVLPLGGKTDVSIKVDRRGGFDGEIHLSTNRLPEGVSAVGDWVIPAGKLDAKVSLESSKDAPVVGLPVQISGSAIVDEVETIRTAAATSAGVLNPLTAADKISTDIMLAMTMSAPIEILVVDKERQRDVHRGTTYLAELELVRNEGFTGEIQLEMSAKQDRQRMGTRGPTLIVPPEQNRAWYPCFSPEWVPMDLTRRIVVHGVVAVPDPKGNVRYLNKPGNARITMIMEGALLKVSAGNKDAVCRIGSTVEVPVTISRSAKLPLPVTVKLNIPEEADGLLNAASLLLNADQTDGILRIESRGDSRLMGTWNLTLSATALQEGQWPVVSQTDIQIEYQKQ